MTLSDMQIDTDTSKSEIVFGPATPCFEDIAVPRGHRLDAADFATYLHHALRHWSGGDWHESDHYDDEDDYHRLAEKDIVATAIKICMLENPLFRFDSREAENAFARLLLACADADITRVKALHNIFAELAGWRALDVELLVQILIAVALNNHNNGLVSELVITWLWSHWLFSGKTGEKPLSVWVTLLRSGWVEPCGDMMEFVYRAQNTPEESLHAIYIFERVLQSKEGLPTTVLSTIEQTVKMGPPAVVAHILVRLPHWTIEPRPHFLLRDAASRFRMDRRHGMQRLGAEMLEALRPMNLDVNCIIDPRGKAEGVSPLEQTPLHVATRDGNMEVIRWCLKNGAKPKKDCYRKYQWEDVKDVDKEKIFALYRAEGWNVNKRGSST